MTRPQLASERHDPDGPKLPSFSLSGYVKADTVSPNAVLAFACCCLQTRRIEHLRL